MNLDLTKVNLNDEQQILDSLSLSSVTQGAGMSEEEKKNLTTEERKALMMAETLDKQQVKKMKLEAKKPGYLKSTVSTDADTRFESAAEQNYKRTYESFRVTNKELENSSSPMRRAMASTDGKGEAGQQLKTGPNAWLRLERQKKVTERLNAELKVEKTLRKEFEEKVARLEGKVVGIQMALSRERGMRQDLESKLGGSEASVENTEGARSNPNGGNKAPPSNSAAARNGRQVEVLKERLREAIVETERQRLIAKETKQDLSKSHEMIKSLEHIISSIRNNHTYKTLSDVGKQKRKQLVEQKRKAAPSKAKNKPTGRDQRGRSTSPKRKSPRKVPNEKMTKQANNRKHSGAAKQQRSNDPSRKRAYQGRAQQQSHTKPERKQFNKAKNSHSDSSLSRIKKGVSIKTNRKRENYQNKLTKSVKNKYSIPAKKHINQQQLNAHQHHYRRQAKKFPRLSPVDTFVSVDTSQIEPMEGQQIIGNLEREQRAAVREQRRHERSNTEVTYKTEHTPTENYRQSEASRDSPNAELTVSDNGNIKLPFKLSSMALSEDGMFSDKVFEEEFGF
jgi:hypothetical protein